MNGRMKTSILILILLLILLIGCFPEREVSPIPVDQLEKGSGAMHWENGRVLFPNGRNNSEGADHLFFVFRTGYPEWSGEWSIEKHVEGNDKNLMESTWHKVPFAEDATSEQITLELHDGIEVEHLPGYTSYEFSNKINLAPLAYKLDAGLYRLVLKSNTKNGDIWVGGFSVGDVDDLDADDIHVGVSDGAIPIQNDRVQIKLTSDIYSEQTEAILYTYEAIDGKDYLTGCGASLEKNIDGTWYHLYNSGTYEAVASALPGQQVLYTSSYYFLLTEGQYRVVKHFSAIKNKKELFYATCEFTVSRTLQKPEQADFVAVKLLGVGRHGAEFLITNHADAPITYISNKNMIIQAKKQGKWITIKPGPREQAIRTHDHPSYIPAGESEKIAIQDMAETYINPDGSKDYRLVSEDIRAIFPIWHQDGTEYFVVCSPG